MAERREYRSSIRSRRMIREAFLALLDEKEFGKITVTDITNRADLNRSTFYAHYPDVQGVVEEIQDEIIHKNMEMVRAVSYRNILKDPMPYLNSICTTLDENMKLYSKMGHSAEVHRHLDKYRRIIVEELVNHPQIPEKIREAPFFEIRIHFFIGGMMNTYQQWAEGILNCTLEEISREIAGLIQKSAADLIGADWDE